eukprot:scaffold2882_cov434-Prasinococcus_capsulatus_cf.AAC.11
MPSGHPHQGATCELMRGGCHSCQCHSPKANLGNVARPFNSSSKDCVSQIPRFPRGAHRRTVTHQILPGSHTERTVPHQGGLLDYVVDRTCKRP